MVGGKPKILALWKHFLRGLVERLEIDQNRSVRLKSKSCMNRPSRVAAVVIVGK